MSNRICGVGGRRKCGFLADPMCLSWILYTPCSFSLSASSIYGVVDDPISGDRLERIHPVFGEREFLSLSPSVEFFTLHGTASALRSRRRQVHTVWKRFLSMRFRCVLPMICGFFRVLSLRFLRVLACSTSAPPSLRPSVRREW